ncbi:RING-type domain-containing protein [Caenorhabditis elegans]|uniref:RING-type domain-containing protein n=1 Tax=Caenorhabditis elegans TaxID=6239 RepID=F5GU49_CAEEL|nr:RING-type domain-containing protein [Caenorhabditis elegans]CCD67913.1 RING-type domain-containing protein [Caenorhabditis elegans]|eukprot:NP_001257050.1 Uncharacterized protein CELE_F27D9.12 [Caenorhabditis elegans]
MSSIGISRYEDGEENCCTACLEFMHERRSPPSCEHNCVACFYLLIARRTNCLICNVTIYEIERIFKDLRSRVNIEANRMN